MAAFLTRAGIPDLNIQQAEKRGTRRFATAKSASSAGIPIARKAQRGLAW